MSEGRQLNFTYEELQDMLLWPEAAEPLERPFAVRFCRTFGVNHLTAQDELVRWDVPAIPCPEVPRIGVGDVGAVIAHYGRRGLDA